MITIARPLQLVDPVNAKALTVPRDGDHALLHDADLLEQVGDLHRDLARHVGELQRQRQHHRDGADLHHSSLPQHQRHRAGAGDQQRVEQIEDGSEHRQQALRG